MSSTKIDMLPDGGTRSGRQGKDEDKMAEITWREKGERKFMQDKAEVEKRSEAERHLALRGGGKEVCWKMHDSEADT